MFGATAAPPRRTPTPNPSPPSGRLRPSSTGCGGGEHACAWGWLMTSPILELLNVESNYGPVQALRGVSLAVPEGRIIAVLGANGAGKTTTLKTISGILAPRKGQVKFRGQDIQEQSPDKIVRA